MRKPIFAILMAMATTASSLCAQVIGPAISAPVVSTLSDSEPGSLRQTLLSVGPGITITFATNLSGGTILLTNGLIELTRNVIIDGSALSAGIQINGNQNSTIFQVDGGVQVVLDSLTLTNGNSTNGFGGAIFSEGNLTLNDCVLVNNQSAGTAGALACAFGSLVMNRTTVSGNLGNNCSAIYIQDQPATIADCTISGNHGNQGDALRLQAAYGNPTLFVNNSTFTGNHIANLVGAAVSIMSSTGVTATAYFTNCTVVSNLVEQTSQPGAIFLQSGGGTNNLTLYNSIVCGNTSGGAPGDITGMVAPGSSFNLIGVGGGLVNGSNGNQVGNENPQLAALGNYGGHTQTMPPLPGSPVIDAGGPTSLTIDQRGLPRPAGGATDIGAVESQTCTGAVTVDSSTIFVGTSATLTATNTANNPGYFWSDGETSQSITVTPASTTNYTVKVFDGLSACIATASSTVTVVPQPTAEVTFQVDMSAEVLAGLFNPLSDFVAVGGDFNGWSTDSTLTHNPGAANPNIYSTILTVTHIPGYTNYYKFVVDGGQNLGWEEPVSTRGGNRSFIFSPTNNQQILPLVYFSDLSPTGIILSNTLVTFTVDMTGAVGSEGHDFDPTVDSVYLNGNFTGWWPWGTSPAADLLTNIPGTEFYTLTLPLATGAPRMLVYNYGMNGNADESADQQNHVRYVQSTDTDILPTDIFGLTLAESLITWPTPTPITYGTLLDSNQLNATANVSGTFTYNPPAGSALDAGTQTLTAIFIPDSTNNYPATNAVNLVVTPAPLTVTVSNLSRAFGQTNPVLTAAVLGLQNGDNITAKLSSSAGLTSLPGIYPIKFALVDPGHRLGNYLVTTNPGVLTVTSGAQILAHDDSSAYSSPQGYVVTQPQTPNKISPNVPGGGTWMTGQNFGFGFLPWVIQTNGPASQGAFIGAGGSIAAVDGSAWALYANGQPFTNTAVAFRGLSNSLPVGLALKLEWRSGYIGTNSLNFAGFSLRSGNASASTADLTTGERVAFFYRGSADTTNPIDDVIIRDGAGENYAPAPGVNFVSLQAGIAVEFTLLSSNTYRLLILDAATSNTIATFDNRTLAGSGTIDSLALFDNQTDPLDEVNDGNQYFNNLEISNPLTPVLPAAVVTPANLAVTASSNATFTATATGTPPLIYQWQFDGKNLTGAIGASLTISNVQVNNGGQYAVVVESPYGIVISPAAILSIITPTRILVPPASAQVSVGGNATFSVVALSSAPLTYQWFFGGNPIPGATNPAYQVLDAQLSSGGNYTVQIANPAGSVASASAALLVVPAPPSTVITLSYNINIQAGTNLIANQLDLGGDTLYEIMPRVPDGTVVSKYDNASGTWSSAAYNAALGAWVPSSIVLRPGEGAEMISPTNFSLTFTGTPHVPSLPLNIPSGQAWLVSRQTNDIGTYENIVGTLPAPGAVIYQWSPTNSNYTLYTYTADGWSGGVEPTAAVGEPLWIGPTGGSPTAIPLSPVITMQPANVTVAQGGSATFAVAATGTDPLLYQWQLDGNAIPDATNPVYNIPDVQAASAGNYSVVIANSIGVTNSDIVSLDLLDSGGLPVADDFANAGILTNLLGGIGAAANFGATIELGEPTPGTIPFGSSVWVQWQPPVDGIASLNTAGSSFDTVLGVFTGTQLTNLQLVAADDDSGPNLTSAITFNAIGGTIYYIQISGFHGAQGDILFAWSLTPAADTTPVIVQQPQNQTQTNSGQVTLSVQVTNTALGVTYQWSLDNVPLPGATNSVYTIPSLDPTQVGLYTVGITNVLSLVGVASVPASVDIFDPGADQPGNFVNIHPQDKFYNAAALTPHDPNIPDDPSFAGGFTGTQTYSSIGATADPGEPNHCGYPPCHSVWYSYVPPASGLLTMNTTNNFNAILEVYTGPATSFATLIPVACSANHGANGEAVALSVTAGSNYWIVVDGVNCASGNFTLGYALYSPPVFATSPVGQTVTQGSTINLVASIAGTPPLFYQWKFMGNNIPNATNSSLAISNFQSFNQGNYSVVTWNPAGTNFSASAALYLSSPPRFVSFGVISGSVSAQFVGVANANYIVEASSNMVNWLPVTTNSSPIGIFNFYDQVPLSVANRFYRAISP